MNIKFNLQQFATPITELFPQKDLLDYTRNRAWPTLMGDTLFPARKVNSLEVDMLLEGNRTPVIADYSAFDAEASTRSRDAQKMTAELAYVKSKMQLKETDLYALAKPRDAAEQAYLQRQVYNDIDRLVQGVLARGEAMTMEMLATGKITDKKHNIAVDYGVPKSHQADVSKTKPWSSDSADILLDLETWSDTLDITPTRALTSKKVLSNIYRNQKLIANVYGNNSGRILGQADLDAFLTARGLPIIRSYDGKYKAENGKGGYTSTRYFPENSIVLMNDDTLGEKLYGPTPDELRVVANGSVQASQIGNVFAKIYESGEDPVATWELASATMLPTFAAVDEVFQAQVLA